MTQKIGKDNFYRNFLIFFACFTFFFGIVLPLLDEFAFSFAYKKMMCEYGFYIPTNSTRIWCGEIVK